MSSLTTNLRLWLYEVGQKFRITQNSDSLNDNFTKIDSAIGSLPSGRSLQEEIGSVPSGKSLQGQIGDTALPTTAQTLTGAIAEHETDISSQNSAMNKSVCPIITGANNDSGVAIASGEYFCVADGTNDGLYLATAAIGTGVAWSGKGTLQSAHGGLNALNSNLTKFVEIPQSDFTWDSTKKQFVRSSASVSGLTTIYGVIAFCINGTAIMGGWIYPTEGKTYVYGWLPRTGESIDSSYNFKCFAVGK